MARHGLMQSAPLASQNDRCRRIEFNVVVGLIGAFVEAVDPVPALFQILDRAADIGDADNRKIGQSARGRARDRFGEARRAPFRNYDGRRTRRMRGPRNRSEIVRIFHAIEDYVEPAACRSLVERRVTLRRPEPYDALMRGAPRGAVQLRSRFETHRDPPLAAQLDQLLKSRTGGAFSH